MKKPRLILVGGFLGAGKTSLIFETTMLLMQNGKQIGLITNDQALELVDTAILLQTTAQVAEVSGSCFCCNFNGLIDSIKNINADLQTDIIIAEPVGSCTDLSATILQPIKDQLKDELLISPLTVLADPFRLADILEERTSGLHPSAAYIYKKQLEEGDIILITKSDLITSGEMDILKEKAKTKFPDAMVLSVSSKTGEGIEDWLSLTLEYNKAGNRIVDVDYDRYAEGEAVLGWLNSVSALHGEAIDWDHFASQILSTLSQHIYQLQVAVGHIKIIIQSGRNYIAGNLTGKFNTITLKGSAGISNDAQIIINARIEAGPELLEELIKDVLDIVTKKSITIKTIASRCFSPAYPTPTFRYHTII